MPAIIGQRSQSMDIMLEYKPVLAKDCQIHSDTVIFISSNHSLTSLLNLYICALTFCCSFLTISSFMAQDFCTYSFKLKTSYLKLIHASTILSFIGVKISL